MIAQDNVQKDLTSTSSPVHLREEWLSHGINYLRCLHSVELLIKANVNIIILIISKLVKNVGDECWGCDLFVPWIVQWQEWLVFFF